MVGGRKRAHHSDGVIYGKGLERGGKCATCPTLFSLVNMIQSYSYYFIISYIPGWPVSILVTNL